MCCVYSPRFGVQDYVNQLAMCLLESNNDVDTPAGQRLEVNTPDMRVQHAIVLTLLNTPV
jgi:hypothetical protein